MYVVTISPIESTKVPQWVILGKDKAQNCNLKTVDTLFLGLMIKIKIGCEAWSVSKKTIYM